MFVASSRWSLLAICVQLLALTSAHPSTHRDYDAHDVGGMHRHTHDPVGPHGGGGAAPKKKPPMPPLKSKGAAKCDFHPTTVVRQAHIIA